MSNPIIARDQSGNPVSFDPNDAECFKLSDGTKKWGDQIAYTVLYRLPNGIWINQRLEPIYRQEWQYEDGEYHMLEGEDAIPL